MKYLYVGTIGDGVFMFPFSEIGWSPTLDDVVRDLQSVVEKPNATWIIYPDPYDFSITILLDEVRR